MTWQTLAVGIVLAGAVVAALAPLWRFVRAAAKAPAMIERMAEGFGDGPGNLHGSIDKLTASTDHLRASNHDIAGKMSLVIVTAGLLGEKIDKHIDDDAEFNRQVFEQLAAARELTTQVKVDLELRLEKDRRGLADIAANLAKHDITQAEGVAGIASDLAASQKRADAVEGDVPGAAADAGARSEDKP